VNSAALGCGRPELGGDVAVTDDRTGDELREQQDVQREFRDAALHARRSLEHVDDV
jgi:hypothetical protein